jgi:hypothetical protein
MTASLPESAPATTPVGKAKSRWRRLALNLSLLGVVSAICLLLLEGAVRWLFPYYRPSAQINFYVTNGVALGPAGQTFRHANTKGDYELKVTFNAYGLRDSKDLKTAQPADWFALGDSYTLGWGVEESQRFGDQLQQHLQSNGVPVRVFNVAIPENLIGYARLMKYAEGLGANMHHVVLGLCMENDLWDYTPEKSFWDDHAGQRRGLVRTWFKAHSALYLAASHQLQSSTASRLLMEKLGVANRSDQLAGYNTWNETALKTSKEHLLSLVAGRDVVVLIIPSRRLWSPDTAATEARVHEAFVRSLREANVTVVDVRAALEAGGDPMRYYFKTDPHWNAEGHAVAGRELFKVISSRRPPAGLNQ